MAKGSEIPQANSAHTNISKLLHDHKNKQRQLREEIKVISLIIVTLRYAVEQQVFIRIVFVFLICQARVEHLTSEVVHEYLQRKPHRAVKGDFATFPTNELTRALKA